MNNPAFSADLDAARAAFPRLGYAIYAYDPDGPMTLEVHTPDGQTFSFTGPSEAALILRAFPSLRPPDPPPAIPTPNVFD
jgi:hypothetical protein